MSYSIEAVLVSWLRDEGYAAYTDVPADRPERFVTVEREGGGTENMVDLPGVTVQTWGRTRAEAESDAQAIKRLVELASATGTLPDGVYTMRTNAGPYPFDDPDSRERRYQTLFDISCLM